MISAHSGLRKTTAKSIESSEFARAYRADGARRITRNVALGVAKLAAAAMGLKTAKIAMIDQLFACSKACDWTSAEVSPVVWPSNARLAQSLGISVSTMKYHLNGLVQAGLIAYSDGPTYQRRGRRDADGNIIEAYGIDLSPIATRFAELTEMVEAAAQAARQWRQCSYRRTVVRKEIQSLIFSAVNQELPGPWAHAQARIDVIRETRTTSLDEIGAQVADLEAMQTELEEAYQQEILDIKFKSAVSKFRPLLTTAEPSESENSREQRPRANAREPISKIACGELAFEQKPARAVRVEQDPPGAKVVLDSDLSYISLPLVEDACPQVAALIPGAFGSWSSLRDAGRDLCVAVGINPQVWQEAVSVLGPDLAVAAVAVTVQKAEMGLVAKPGAYLRTMTQRARTGDLHISRSLFGLAQSVVAEDRSSKPEPVVAPSFPVEGSVHFSIWAAVIREHAPKPTPDVDLVAQAFRRWAREQRIDLSSPNVERTLIGFCRKWKLH